MNKKIISLSLAGSVLLAVPLYGTVGFLTPALAATGMVHMDELVDIKPRHWAYDAVKYVVEDLSIMAPKTPTRFLGDQKATRYELANAFYNAVKGLEQISEKDLRLNENSMETALTDVNADNRKVVGSVVNEYGLMQLMPDNKFMGNREMTRYELAFDLNNYLMLLEKKLGEPSRPARDRLIQLTDVPDTHWAYRAIKNIVDKDQIMDGYPQNVFGGDQKLTRYEVAALLRRFVEYVDNQILPLTKPTPTPVPTPEPTPVPTPEPTPVPTPTPRPVSFDIKAGAALKNFSASAPFDPAVNLDAGIWWERFGFSLSGEALFNETGTAFTNASRYTFGGSLNWKIIGFERDEDPAIIFGLGYGAGIWQGTGAGQYSLNHGPKAELTFDIPFNPWIGLYVKDSFSYYIAQNQGLRNDAFAGFSIPAYGLVTGQLGYVNTWYSLSGTPALNNSLNGVQANIRFRF
jgi:hypothetical protein